MNEDVITGLLNKVVMKDEHAFKQLYELTHKRVFHYIYRLTYNHHRSEDLLIETYTEVWKSAERFKCNSKVLTWIIGIARNLTMNEFRKNKIEGCEVDDEISYQPDQHSNCEHSDTSKILQTALEQLPVKHREILDLVFLQEMKYEEISEVMNIPVNTVKTRVFYAKDNLRKILTSMGMKSYDLI